MVKRPAQRDPGAPAKRRKGQGSELLLKENGRIKSVIEPLLQNGILLDCGAGSSASAATGGWTTLLNDLSLPECNQCVFHRSHGLRVTVSVNDIRQRVSSWAWGDVKKLLHRQCVYSITVQHSKDCERVLLRGFLHVPHDDVEVCSCNGTPTAARVSRTAAAAATKAARGDARAGSNGDTAATIAAASDGLDTGGCGGSAAGAAAPGTCGPAERYSHVVEVVLRTEDWSMTSCSSSCCGVGYDAMHSQLCPAVAAVLLAARMGGGNAVLCEHDTHVLARLPSANQPIGVQGAERGPGKAADAAAPGSTAEGVGAAGWPWWDPALGLGPPTVARVVAAASGGAVVVGPNHVDPLPPPPASLLLGPGVPLNLQRELDSPRRIPEAIRSHLIRSSCPAAAAEGGGGPSTSVVRPAAPAEPPPVPPPHVPVLPAVEAGSGGHVRFQSGYPVGSFPSATARAAFAGWFREGAPVVVTTDRYRETFRMLLPPEDTPPAGAAAGADGAAAGGAGGSTDPPVWRPPAPSGPPPAPTVWSFGASGGSVSLELSGDSPARYISSRAAERGPVWEARMAFLTSHAAFELDPELRLHTGGSESSDPWPPVVLGAFDEASCPVGQPAGSNGPAGALCGLLRVTWLCLHVWDLDAGLAKRAKLVVQAVCKLLLAADLPNYLRAAAARLLGSWRLRLGDAAAHGRRPGYGSSNDVAVAELLTRLTTAHILARDGWDAPHVCAAMGIISADAVGPAAAGTATDKPLAASARGGAALMTAPGRMGHPGSLQQQGVAGAPAAGTASALPDLQPTWTGFRPANQAAARRRHQHQQPQVPAVGRAGAHPALAVAAADPYGSGASTVAPPMPFMPYAPPPLQGVVKMSTPGLQEVTERLHWLGHYGLDGPYVSLAAASGEWSKAIKMLLRRGAKPDVERACRLAVERLSSAAAKAQQACFLLHQVLGPLQPPPQKPDAASDTAAAQAGGSMAAVGGQSSAAEPVVGGAGAGPGAGGVDSLVVSAVALLPPTFVAGCAGRMFMSAVRAALSIKTDASDAVPHSNATNAAFEMSFLRANANPQQEAASPAAALLAAITPTTGGGAAGTRPSPYTALLRSVIAMVAENQGREWLAEEEALRDAGLLDDPAAGATAADEVSPGHCAKAGDGGGGGSEATAAAARAATAGGAGAGGSAGPAMPRATEYAAAMASMSRHAAAAPIQRRDLMLPEQCDCDACRRERRERLAQMESELPPGTVQFTKLRPEDACFVSDPAALAAFAKVLPLVTPRAPGSGPRMHSLAVQVVRSVFQPMMATLADPRERPRTPAEYAVLLGTVEESMGTLCDDFMPERVQLQAVLEGVTCALCSLYSCHNTTGATPAALGRVVTDLLAADQLALARQVAACQLAMTRSPDSLAHTLEVAVAGGEEAQREMSLELLRAAATDPPPEQRIAAAVAARVARHMPDNGLIPPALPPGMVDLYRPHYMDDSDEYDSDDYGASEDMPYDFYGPISDEDDDDDDMEDDEERFQRYMFAAGVPYGNAMMDAEMESQRQSRRERREERRLLREERRVVRAALQAQLHPDAAGGAAGAAGVPMVDLTHDGNDTGSELTGNHSTGSAGRRRRGTTGLEQGGGGDESAADDDSDINTEDLLAGRRGDDGGDMEDEGGEEVTGPALMEVDEEEAERARIRAEKGKAPAPMPSPHAHARRRHADTGGGGGSGAGPSNAAGPGPPASGHGAGRPHRRRHAGHEDAPSAARQAPSKPADPGAEAGAAAEPATSNPGPHELAVMLASSSSGVLFRRLVRWESDQNMFALAQYIRGRGASAELVAPLMAGAVTCLDTLSMPAVAISMDVFSNEMMANGTPPLRHASRLEGRNPDIPCLKGLPASSWQSFTSARNYRYATSRDEAGLLRELVVSMDYRDPLVLTAWVCAAYSAESDLQGRRRVLSAMALSASRRYGPALAHLGLALARCGLSYAAVAVASRALAPAAVRYATFTANPHGAVPAVGQSWYSVCLLGLAPKFVEVLEQVVVGGVAAGGASSASDAPQHQQPNGNGGDNGSAAPGAARTAAEANASAAPARAGVYPVDAAAEEAAAAEAEAEGRGVGEWRLPRLDAAAVRSAVAALAVTLLLLRCELPRCLLGCAEAVTAVMALLSKVATRCGVKHEQLFEGGGAGSLGAAAPTADARVSSLREWVVVAMRECLLVPLRSAPREVQQAFVTAVAAMPDNELDFKMKIPLLEWARGARVPVATIFDAASRAVLSATRSLEAEAAADWSALHQAIHELQSISAAMSASVLGPGGPIRAQNQMHAASRAASLGIHGSHDALAVQIELDLALIASSGKCSTDVWIEDKRTPASSAATQLHVLQNLATSAAANSGHRSWVWHVLKWVGERLVEEMVASSAAIADGEPRQQSAGGAAAGAGRGSSRPRRSAPGSASASRDTSPVPLVAATGSGQVTDPRVMLRQLVDRTGAFRGPELLPLACTLLDVVARDGPGSPFLESARQLLGRAVVPEAGRAASLASNEAWRSAEYRAGLRRILDHWKAERDAATPPPDQGGGRPRRGRASSPPGNVGSSATVSDDLAERVALTLVLAEGSVSSLRDASEVMDITRPAGAAGGAAGPAVPTARASARSSTGGSAGRASPQQQQPRLELRLPYRQGGSAAAAADRHGSQFGQQGQAAGGGWAAPLQLASAPAPAGARSASTVLNLNLNLAAAPAPAPAPAPAAAGRRGRGQAAMAAAVAAAAAAAAAAYHYPGPPDIRTVDEAWEDRGEPPAATMSAAAGWVLEPLSLHNSLRRLLALGVLELSATDPCEAATLRFLQVQAAVPSDAVPTALAPLGSCTDCVNTGSAASGVTAATICGSFMGRKYTPRFSVAVWRLVLQLMRRDPALLACWRGAAPAMDNVHGAMQVGTRALAPGTSAARTLTWQRRMEAPAVAAAASLSPPHVRCAVAMLRVWVGARWLLGTCQPPPAAPQGMMPGAAAYGVAAGAAASAAGGGNARGDDLPLQEKEPAVAMLVDDIQRLYKLIPDLAMDCIRENTTKYPEQQQQQQQQPAMGGVMVGDGGLMHAVMQRVQHIQQLAAGGPAPAPGPGPGLAAGPSAGPPAPLLPLGGGSALLKSEEVGQLNQLDGFVAALGEHVRADPAAKKVLAVLQPRLPVLHDKVLRFLQKHRGCTTREALVAKLHRDFNLSELDAMQVAHLPWKATPGGTKAVRAAELAEWIVEHQMEYLDQQGNGSLGGRRRHDYWVAPYYA